LENVLNIYKKKTKSPAAFWALLETSKVLHHICPDIPSHYRLIFKFSAEFSAPGPSNTRNGGCYSAHVRGVSAAGYIGERKKGGAGKGKNSE
jgi:hypothetical protein